jgi:hypothetical protein
MLEKDEEGKNKLKITARSAQFLRRQRWHETVAAQQRPVRPTGAVGQADCTHQQSHSAELPQGVVLANSSTSAKSAKPTVPIGLADSLVPAVMFLPVFKFCAHLSHVGQRLVLGRLMRRRTKGNSC